MKHQVIVLSALLALVLAPAFGATRKMNPSDSKSKTEATETRVTRVQADARELVSDLTTTQKSKMLTLLNEGDAKDLSAIKGISKTRGTAIEKARPFDSIDEVILVKGIGEGTFAEIISHARSLTTSRSSSKKKS